MDRCNCCNVSFAALADRGKNAMRYNTRRDGFPGECCFICRQRMDILKKRGVDWWRLGVRTGPDGRPVRLNLLAASVRCKGCRKCLTGRKRPNAKRIGLEGVYCQSCRAKLAEKAEFRCDFCNQSRLSTDRRVRFATIAKKVPEIHAMAKQAGELNCLACNNCYYKMKWAIGKDTWCHCSLSRERTKTDRIHASAEAEAKIRDAIRAIRQRGGFPTFLAIAEEAGVSQFRVRQFSVRYQHADIIPTVGEFVPRVGDVVSDLRRRGQPVLIETIAKITGFKHLRVSQALGMLSVREDSKADTPMIVEEESLSTPDIESRIKFYQRQVERNERNQASVFADSPWAREYRRKEWA